MLLTVPLLYPSFAALGFNGVWVGVILVVFIELGALTPPMGLNLFAIQSIAPGQIARRRRHGLHALLRADRRILFPALCVSAASRSGCPPRSSDAGIASSADVCTAARRRPPPSSRVCRIISASRSRHRNGTGTSRACCPRIRCSRAPPSTGTGNLYCVDIPWGRVFRIDPKGEFTLIAEYDGEPNGLKIHRDGRIFIADYKHGIMVLDPARRAGVAVPGARPARAAEGRQRSHLRLERRSVFHRSGIDRLARSDRPRVSRAGERARSIACSTMCRARTGSCSIPRRERALCRGHARQCDLARAADEGRHGGQGRHLHPAQRRRRPGRACHRRGRAISSSRISGSASCGCSARAASRCCASIPAQARTTPTWPMAAPTADACSSPSPETGTILQADMPVPGMRMYSGV